MPSPFAGMDPYLEGEMWQEFRGGVKRGMILLSLVALLAVLAGCGAASLPTSPEAPSEQPATALPPPRLDGSTSLEQALAQRRSVREFGDAPLTTEQIGQLLWATQGITSDEGFRTAPSAGALYPLEIYLATAEGLFHYEPQGHRLRVTARDDVRQNLYEAALRQDPVRRAPAIFVITAVVERTARKYGEERSPRYVQLEAGHAAQNLLLEAVSLDLGAVPIGAFDDEQVQNTLGLPAGHEPLYVIPVGHPQGAPE
jgi:SagB-type dehydrogenase family enzyme